MIRTGISALLTLAATVAVAWMPLRDTDKTASNSYSVLAVESVTKRTAGKAPDFTFKDGTKSTSFAELTAGKVVVLNFWTTWCGPCRREIPDLVELHKEMASKGVMVIGVSLDQADNRIALVKAFAERSKIPYYNFVDNTEFKLAEAYGGIQSVPTTFIIDRKGNVVQRLVGAMSKSAFSDAVTKAM